MFDDVKAIKQVQRINSGGQEMLSKSQIVNLIINMSDIAKVNDKETTDRCYELFKQYRSDKKKELYDRAKYYAVATAIQSEFDKMLFLAEIMDSNDVAVERSEYDILFASIYEDITAFARANLFLPEAKCSYDEIEVCTQAAVMFLDKTFLQYEVNEYEEWYYRSLIKRVGEEKADVLMMTLSDVYNKIHKSLKVFIEEAKSDTQIEDSLITLVLYAAAIHAGFPRIFRPANNESYKEMLISPEKVIKEYVETEKTGDEDFDYNIAVMAKFLTVQLDHALAKKEELQI